MEGFGSRRRNNTGKFTSILSSDYKGMARHHRGQVDYFTVLQGALKIRAYDDTKQEINESTSPQIVKMPRFKELGNGKAIVIYFTSRLYDYANPDEERWPWSNLRMESSSP